MKGSEVSPSSGQAGSDCRKDGSTMDCPDAEVVSSESADMRGGGSSDKS